MLLEEVLGSVSSLSDLFTPGLPALQAEDHQEKSLGKQGDQLSKDEIEATAEVDQTECTFIAKLFKTITDFYF